MKILFLTLSAILWSLFDLIYWIYFWNKNNELALSNFPEFKNNYINSLPKLIRPLYGNSPQYIDIILFLLLVICGIILIKNTNKLIKLLSLIAFMFAFRHLFSMM